MNEYIPLIIVFIGGASVGLLIALCIYIKIKTKSNYTRHTNTSKTTWNHTEGRPMTEEEEKSFDKVFEKMDDTFKEMKNFTEKMRRDRK